MPWYRASRYLITQSNELDATQVFELTKQQEITKQQELKTKEAEQLALQQQYAKVRRRADLSP